MRQSLVLLSAAILLTMIALPLVPMPYTLQTTAGGADLSLMATQRIVWRCADVTWRLDNIRAVVVNGEGRVGEDTEHLCLSLVQPDVAFDITFADGETSTLTVPVTALLYEPVVLLAVVLAGVLLVTAWMPVPTRSQPASPAAPEGEKPMSALPGVVTNLLLMLVGLGTALVVLELAMGYYLTNIASEDVFLRFASRPQIEAHVTERGLEYRYLPHQYIGYYPNANHPQHNAQGFRGDEIEVPKPMGTFRIVMLGGSTTYSDGVDDNADTFTVRLQAHLREVGYTQVEVVNAGASSYSSFESLAMLHYRVLDLDPDLVMVYHGINDIHPRLVWPPEAYRGDNAGHRIDPSLNVPFPALWEYSNVLRVAAISAGLTDPFSALERTLYRTSLTSYWVEFERQQLDGTYPSGIFEETSAMEMLDANPPIYFERNLRSMTAIANANGFDIVLVTFIHSPEFPDEPRVASDEYIRAYAEGNAVVRRVALETDAALFDFAEVMPTDAVYFTDGRHFTAEGNRYRAELYADYLIEAGYLPQPTATARE